ncbi:PAS domain-containing protein [Salinisphaera aquimarina]|uniref:Diguanylate cyclase n=1 Tax=Salinisphaera aquimarina TaxID=2094031 RepID=A0ABV7ET19_9GAMM
MEQIAIDVLERHALGGTWWYDLQTRRIWWSKGIYRIHDVDPADYTPTPETVADFYEPESRANVRKAIVKAIEQGSGWSLTLLLRRSNGQLRYVHSVAQVEPRPGMMPVLAGAFFDIHEATVERIEREARQQRELEQQSRRWRLASENAGLALIDFDPVAYRVAGAIAEYVGASRDHDIEIPAEQWLEYIHPDDRKVRQQRLEAYLAGQTEAYVSEYRLCLPDIPEIWVQEAACRPAEDDAGDRMLGTLSDIRERKRAERAIFQAREMAEITFEAIGEGLVRVDRDGQITEVNSAACALLGCDAGDMINARFSSRFRLYEAASRRRVPDPVGQVLRHGQRIRVPIFTRLRRSDGAYLSIADSISPIHDEEGRVCGAVFVFQDISEIRRMTEDLVHQASHDPLTGLLNRRGFEQALEAAWRRVRAGMAHIFVLYLDMDEFKQINDNCGHSAGDEVLRRVARSFRAILRDSDVLARLGGDEFAAIIHAKAVDDVETIANKLIAAAEQERTPAGSATRFAGVSVGVAALDPTLASMEAALIHADAALYVAKAAGRGRYHFHDSVAHPWRRRDDDACDRAAK